ncbi:hypothetical protein RhiLY_02190 [Ceratobasidium sp. AG-Ba]|nr:hypothetical protein RhiLY_02190 [Ceratobasidium sp. AG-Ba]
MRLEYSVKKKYTIPYLTAYFSGVSVFALTGLTVLNVILQGYDVVTVLRANPNATDPYWWSTSVGTLRSAGRCSPVSLPRKSIISTNSSLFAYELRSTFDSNKRNIEGASAYMANPLRSCTVDSVVANIDFSRWSFKIDVPILCTSSELPFSLSLMSTFSLNSGNVYYDDIISHYIQNRPPREGLEEKQRLIHRDPSSPLNIIAVLDAINSDLQEALDRLRSAAGDTPVFVSTGGIPTCPGGQNTTCRSEDMRMRVPECGITYANGSSTGSVGICPFLAPVEKDLLNLFTVLQDAYHIDFGNIQPSNTLLSMEAFASRIRPSTMLSRAIQSQPNLRICTWGLGCMRGSTWTDQLLASNPDISVAIPSILSAGNTSAVAKVDYLCPEFRMKRLGSLITSMFIGTWSMYTALVGIFTIVGPILEKRYGRHQGQFMRDTHVTSFEAKV